MIINKPGKFTTTQSDLKTDRNAKMIQTLLRPDVNGVLLFYLSGRGEEGFMIPPGLTDEEVAAFKSEFMFLFEKFARRANRN